MKQKVSESIDYAQVRWDSVLVYTKFFGAKGQTGERMEDVQKKAYSGLVAEGTRKRMAKACDILIQCSRVKMRYRPGKKAFPFRLGFLTLTVPGKVVDPNGIHPYFKRFLDWLRYRKSLYVWKAEYQERGQIHYHLIINQYIHFHDLRYYWNKLMREAGQLAEYAKAHGHFNAPSIDIRAVRNDKTLSNYLLKYLLKDNKLPANGHLKKWWGASAALQENRFEYEMGGAESDQIHTSKDIYIDEEKRFLVARGKPAELLTPYTQKAYKEWIVSRIKQGDATNQPKRLRAKEYATGLKAKTERWYQGKLIEVRAEE